MSSVLPTIVSLIFLFYGLFVLNEKGINRVSISFFILCLSSFFWQFCWAVLFQTKDPATADHIIKLGWALILFIPTALYHFLTEIVGKHKELRFVYLSYVIAGILLGLLLGSNYLIDGHYAYPWGFYPKAGSYHWLHVLQTVIVVNRALYITFKKQIIVQGGEQSKLRACIAGVFIYFFAAVDYLCNYGYDFYPPGVIFIAIAIGIIAIATVKFHLMDNSKVISASIAHEMRTPLATINLQAKTLSNSLPILVQGYLKAVENKLIEPEIDQVIIEAIPEIVNDISNEVRNSNESIDMLLALASENKLNDKNFILFSMKTCLINAINKYPYKSSEKDRVNLSIENDFEVLGSEIFMKYVVYNLLKNAFQALREKGDLESRVDVVLKGCKVEVRDQGAGIAKELIPHVFDNFFSTKHRGANSGVGLAFCRRVVQAFNGEIYCESEEGRYTCFTVKFPQSMQC